MVEAGNSTNPFIPVNNADSPQKAGQPVYGLNPFANANQSTGSPAVAKEWQPSAAAAAAAEEAIELRDMSSDEPEQLPWERKAAEIEARTRELRRREAELQARQPMTLPVKNWPPFFSLVYHDIEAEVPAAGQELAKRSFFIWQLTAGAYAVNLVAVLLMMFSGVAGYGTVSGTIFAAIYVVLFPLLAFFAWHFSLYKALKFDSSFWFIVYFVTFGVQLLFYGFLAVGLFNAGSGGIIGMLEMFSHGKIIAGLLAACCAAAMAVCLLMGIALIKQVNDHFRGAGHSIERAGAEAGRAATQNETVRRSAKEAALNAV